MNSLPPQLFRSPLCASRWMWFCLPTRHEASAVRGVQRGSVHPFLLEGRRATLARLGPYSCLTLGLGFPCDDLEAPVAALASGFIPRLVGNFGAAGAINPHLFPGALTIPLEGVLYRQPDLNLEDTVTLAIEPQQRAALESAAEGNIRFTRAGTCPTPVCDEALRHRLRETLGVDTTDCETVLLARLSARYEWAFVALRVITDRAGSDAQAEYRRNASQALIRGAQLLPILTRAWFEA